MNNHNLIIGENIQMKCHLYIGDHQDFDFNPKIRLQKDKQLALDGITRPFLNPSIIFCYTHCLERFSQKLDFFLRPFVLVSHNSDHNDEPNKFISVILDDPKVIYFYSQNVCFYHENLILVPIGLPNEMWCPRSYYDYINSMSFSLCQKTEDTYFNFSVSTNSNKRKRCYMLLKNQIPWIPHINRTDYIRILHRYRFCICPEGNGVDTHRLWECFYLKVVPIVIKSAFISILSRLNFPMVILG